MDAATVTALLGVSLETDKVTMTTAIWAKGNMVDPVKANDRPLSADVPRILHLVFNAHMRHLSERLKVTTNVICMQPMDLVLTSVGMSYILDRQTTRSTTTLASMDLSTITLQEDRP